MKISCIIQARMNSKRFPGKIMKEVNNQLMIDYLVNRIKKVKLVKEIIISTTKNYKDNKLIKHCKKKIIDTLEVVKKMF